MAAAVKTADSYIGSLVRLVTKSDIRYEGFLFHLDTNESIIGLRTVKSFGTEGRRKDGPQVLPSDRIYDFIYFRGSDIRDLQVISSPPPQGTLVVPDDPAIIQSQFPQPRPTAVALTSPDAAQVANISTIAQPILPVAPFQFNLRPNPSAPSSSLWGSSLPPPPVNIRGPAMPNYWPGLIGPSGGISHFQQNHFPPPPQSLVASNPPVQQQAQHQNVNASLAGGSSFAEHLYPLLSPNVFLAAPSPPSVQSNPGQSSKVVSNFSHIPMPNVASSALPTVAVDSSPQMASSLATVLNANTTPAPVTKEPSSVVSPSGSFPTISQIMLSNIDSTRLSIGKVSKLSPVKAEVQSGPKESLSSQPLQITNSDVKTVQASVAEPLASGSTEEALEPLPKFTTKTSHGSPSSQHYKGHFGWGRDGVHRDMLTSNHSNRGRAGGRGNAPNGASSYTHQGSRNHALGRRNGFQPNGVPERNHGYAGSHIRGRGAKNAHVVTRFTEDFDFEAMNEKFNKDEVWNSLGKSNKVESEDGNEDERELDDHEIQSEATEEHVKQDVKPVYSKDDFFDSLSCNTLDRDSRRVRFSEQRKKDAETFGETQRHQRSYGQGPRFAGASQGSYRGRGYGGARGGGRGRGREGTGWGRVT